MVFNFLLIAALAEDFVHPEFHIIIFPLLWILLGCVERRSPLLPWFFDLFAGLCLLFGTFSRIILLDRPCPAEHGADDTHPIVDQFLYMSILSWLAAVFLEWKNIWFLVKLCYAQPR